MNRIQNNRFINIKDNNISSNILGKSVLINIIYLIINVLFFKPFLSITDYQEWEIIVGAYSGNTDFHTKFVQFWYSKFIKFLTDLAPNIPWYPIVFYVLVFISFTTITYLILKNDNNKASFIIVNLLLLFFAYEAYIYIQFTKVAAIVGVAGYFVILSKNTNKYTKLLGLVLVFISFLIRFDIAKMLFGLWIFFAIISEAKNYILTKKICLKKYIGIIMSFTVIFSIFFIIPMFKYSNDEEREIWSEIWQWNEVRASVQDYNPPDYDENIEFYSNENISENDLYIWYNWNNDYCKLTMEKGKKIMSLQPKSASLLSKVVDIKNMWNFFKIFPLKYLTIDVFYYLIILFICGIFYDNKKIFRISCLFQIVILLLFNYYLFINGRYLQHRVDVGMIYAVIIAGIYFMEGEKFDFEKKDGKIIAGMCCILLLCVPFKYYSDDVSYISEKQIENNRNFFEMTYSDDKHYYLIGNSRDNCAISQECFEVFQPIKQGIKRNIIMGASPDNKEILKSLGIENPFLEVINNPNMYFVLDENTNAENAWELYFSEIYQKPVHIELVKTEYDRNIYYVYSD